jgi:uncharacterized protein (DUF2236 family)
MLFGYSILVDSFQHEMIHPNVILWVCLCVYFLSVYSSDTICGGLQAKIPDIEKCLEVVATLQAKKGTGEVRLTPNFI